MFVCRMHYLLRGNAKKKKKEEAHRLLGELKKKHAYQLNSVSVLNKNIGKH